MIFKRSPLRYAHIAGHTSLTYSDNGEFVLTGGSDGDLRKWKSVEDDDPISNCLGEYINCIAYNSGKLYASSDHNTLQRYILPDMDIDGTLLRFTAAVTCIRIVDNFVAAGSEDTVIKVSKNGSAELQFNGHTGPVLSIDISPAKGLLASIAGDGCLKIWDLEKNVVVKSISGLTRTNSFENTRHYGTPVFEPRKQHSLAYANGREVTVLNTSSWDVQCSLSDESTSGTYTCCTFSYDGQYIAAGTSLGEISIFDFMRQQVVKCEAHKDCQSITCLSWHPVKNDELIYCDSNGQLGSILRCTKHTNEDGPDATTNIIEDEAVDFGDIEFEDEHHDQQDHVDNAIAAFNDDEDDDNENCVSIEKLKKKIMGSTGDHILDDDETRDSVSAKSVQSDTTTTGANVKLFKKQPPFQPSSTPTHLDHRYLVWNEVGIVTLHADSADGAIDVEFNDASVHHSLHIPNYVGHTMASLSESVLALASNNSTKLVCVALAASGNKEWSICMPDCECIEALAVTSKLVGVATKAQQLRIFTILGTQRELISLPGQIVAMTGHKERLLVCYHSAPCSETQQYIGALFIQTQGLILRCQQLGIPLQAGRQITWIGFSDCGSPAFCDNMGLIQIYSMRSGCWYPVCDTVKHSQSVSNNYFIIGISERSQIIQAVLCRGAPYPMTNPRPMMQELPMHLPLCDSESEKSQLEDLLLRANMLVAQPNADKIIKETAIKLFALACRSELEARAKELIETIACPDLLSLAVKYATKLGRIHLSDRLYELHSALQEKPESCDEFNDRYYSSPNLQFTHLNTSMENRNKLAPKKIELSSASSSSKRAQVLKRFTTSATSSLIPHYTEESLKTATVHMPLNSQENIFSETGGDSDNDSQIPSTEVQTKMLKQLSSGDSGRSPLNSVNPFASSKRKLNDVDFLSSASSLANKLKMAKK